MQNPNVLLRWLQLSLVAGFVMIQSCASTQQQGYEDQYGGYEGQEGYGGNEYGGDYGDEYGGEEGEDFAGADNYGEDGGYGNYGGNEYGGNEYGGDDYGNYADDSYGGNDYAANNYADTNYGGEGLNNALDETFDDEYAVTDNLGEVLNNAPLNDYGDNVFPENNLGLANAPLQGQSANEIPAMGGYETSPAPFTGGAGGIVKYATGQLSVYDQPEGQVVGELELGDHPLVYDEGGWSRMSDGRYVTNDGLSTRGIGYARPAGFWQ